MKPCPRTIDRPLLILGLEGEDVAVILLLCGVPAIMFSPAVPLIALFFLWPCLAAFKRGKPEGYLIHWLYRQGVGFRGLLPPGPERFYSIYSKEVQDVF